jgi:hypothetical protein
MSYAALQTKEVDLLRSLEKHFESDAIPSEFAVAGYVREAQRLMPIDPSAGHTVMAGASALKWNFDAVLKHCRQAVMFQNSAVVQQNASIASINLRNVGLLYEAADYMKSAADVDPANIEAQTEALAFLYMTGRLTEASAVLQRNMDRGIPVHVEGFEPMMALEGLAEVGVNEEQLIEELKVVYSVLRDFRVRPRGFGLDVVYDPDGQMSVVCGVSILGDYRDEMKIEAEIADRLSKSDCWNPTVLSIEIEGMTVDAHEPA